MEISTTSVASTAIANVLNAFSGSSLHSRTAHLLTTNSWIPSWFGLLIETVQ
ncbi:hypothetical protein RDI58_018678 [Solanum bulbocastanum]|uniref:Uncharacterized protein n=1 Tax=Solanum bulbocastanum TaxID=147425 RepID=A0AAN8TB33_SOLBU